jgi:hypothetical protein
VAGLDFPDGPYGGRAGCGDDSDFPFDLAGPDPSSLKWMNGCQESSENQLKTLVGIRRAISRSGIAPNVASQETDNG